MWLIEFENFLLFYKSSTRRKNHRTPTFDLDLLNPKSPWFWSWKVATLSPQSSWIKDWAGITWELGSLQHIVTRDFCTSGFRLRGVEDIQKPRLQKLFCLLCSLCSLASFRKFNSSFTSTRIFENFGFLFCSNAFLKTPQTFTLTNQDILLSEGKRQKHFFEFTKFLSPGKILGRECSLPLSWQLENIAYHRVVST